MFSTRCVVRIANIPDVIFLQKTYRAAKHVAPPAILIELMKVLRCAQLSNDMMIN